jgi:SAM-dependent methyltransferase
MHAEAYEYVRAAAEPLSHLGHVVEYGSRNINGTVRSLFTTDRYTGIDVVNGRDVDVVADAATWETDTPADCVVCCEVLEHTPDWQLLLASARRILTPGGTLIITAAGPARTPHSSTDGGQLQPGEYYANIHPDDLRDALKQAGFVNITIDETPVDIRATARTRRKPGEGI